MPIISKETWDKLTQEEKDKIRQAMKEIPNETASVETLLIELFPKEAFQPQPLTYEDVARELFKEGAYQLKSAFKTKGNKTNFHYDVMPTFPLNFTSEKQAEKLLALNKLLNVAAYLNKSWKPDWSDNEEKKFFPSLIDNDIRIGYVMRDNSSPVYFRTDQLVQQAIQILGEDTVRLALDSNF